MGFTLAGIGFAHPGKTLFEGLDLELQAGRFTGIIGPNGCGKTTLIQLLLGDIKPHRGRIKTGTRLEVAYFDQHRNVLNPDKSVRDNIADGADRFDLNGNSRHVIGYLKDFLFSPAQVNAPVSTLSGGERNRLMLARLFTRPFNLLVMDEPTNDLDMDTLELLEERLMDFDGTLLLVSHDREFINHIVDRCLVFEGDGRVQSYVGGYDDWMRQRPAPAAAADAKVESTPAPATQEKERPRRQKLSYHEQRELKALPRQIEKLEQAITELQQQLAAPGFYREPAETISAAQAQLAARETELEALYERWETLESS